MFQNVLVGIMCVIAISSVIWSRWLESDDTLKKDNNDDNFLAEEQLNEEN